MTSTEELTATLKRARSGQALCKEEVDMLLADNTDREFRWFGEPGEDGWWQMLGRSETIVDNDEECKG